MKKLIAMTTIALICGFTVNLKTVTEVSGVVLDNFNNQPLANVNIAVKGTDVGTTTGKDGKYSISIPENQGILIFNLLNYKEQQVLVNSKNKNLLIKMISIVPRIVDIETEEELEFVFSEEMVIQDIQYEMAQTAPTNPKMLKRSRMHSFGGIHQSPPHNLIISNQHNTEEYDIINENAFQDPLNTPLSTFSIDVDAAAYSNLRRVVNSGQQPQKDMIRIEEMINYFSYDYPAPKGKHPFSITTEVGQAPWNKNHQLVHIGLQGKKLDYENTEPSNLVFLIDVSGSMSNQNKLPLLKSSLKMLIGALSAKDKISIVAYAGAAGLVLPPTPASEKYTIISALDNLSSGGSTAGGQGIRLAYKVAEQAFIKDGNNRVILATDGDFNVGISSTSEMVRMIEEKRKTGIYLTITGFGMGNYKDGRMEQISNAGNGNYYYIDNISEARKVFVNEMQATLFTIAKDVKIQVEFNPKKVRAYRLIGYENRMLNSEDFNDDKKDAGELGAGHTVTALYEIIPQGVKSEFSKNIDPLRYQHKTTSNDMKSSELLTVKFRYKEPDSSESKLITNTLDNNVIEINNTSDNFRFSASIAEFGMLLRKSEFRQASTYQSALTLALGAKGIDKEGYRQEFINLIQNVKLMERERM